MSDRCHECDGVLATQADYDACPDECNCAKCVSLCWRTWNGDCYGEAVDWRARALRLESDLAYQRGLAAGLAERGAVLETEKAAWERRALAAETRVDALEKRITAEVATEIRSYAGHFCIHDERMHQALLTLAEQIENRNVESSDE